MRRVRLSGLRTEPALAVTDGFAYVAADHGSSARRWRIEL